MSEVRVEDHGSIRIVTINRPSRKNAVDTPTAEALRNAFAEFDADDSLAVAILTGADGTFCAGYDLKSLATSDGSALHDPEGPGPMGPTRMLLSKPVIAAVEGHAVAGGLELALWCDMRVVSENAIFGVYCRRWGVPLIDGGTVRLPRIVGQGRAMDMILTGRPVGAVEAERWGLADRRVPLGMAVETAVALGKEIARFPALCMRVDRRSAYTQWDQPLDEALAAEGRGGEAALKGGAVDGAARFADGYGRGGSFSNI